MSRYYYDLHLHSCLSPCGDDDNTPNNIAGMATLCGLNIIALTDHNTTKNCPAFFEACKRYGLVPIPGMELTTSEDIHVVCLFPELEQAMALGELVEKRRILIPNRVDIFGNQWIMNGEDEQIGVEEHYLTNATTISYEEVPKIVESFQGACFPAHIDRQANGVIAVLGTLPKTPDYHTVEINRPENIETYREKYELQSKQIVVSSDAHVLTSIRDKEFYFDFEDDPYSSARIRHQLIERLK